MVRGGERRSLQRTASRPRRRRGLIRRALLAALIVLAGAACSRPAPSLVLITVDTLRADRLGAYGCGERTSPAIDQLAAGGVLFTEATTTIPRTTQAVASLLTGRLPSEHGVLEIGHRLDQSELTLAEMLGSAGYDTIAISANPVAGPHQGLNQGFDVFVDRRQLQQSYNLRQNLTGANTAGIGPAEAVTSEAILRMEATDRPFFLWLLYMDPHWPYNPPAPHNQVVDWQRFTFYEQMRAFKPARATVYFNLNGRSEAVRPDAQRLYDAEVRYTDMMIDRLLRALRARRHPTLVVLTADHGESLGEHGYYYQHGALVHQPSMRIPLIFSLPGTVPAGRRVEQPVSIIDVLPTTLALLGIDTPEVASTGRDLGRLWQQQTTEPSPADSTIHAISGSVAYPENPLRALGRRSSQGLRFARDGDWVLVDRHGQRCLYDAAADPSLTTDLSTEHPQVAEQISAAMHDLPDQAYRWQMVRQGRWKLIRMPELHGVRFQLFDLEQDPQELQDLSYERPEVVQELERLFTAVGADVEAVAGPVPEEVEEQLRALGYIDE